MNSRWWIGIILLACCLQAPVALAEDATYPGVPISSVYEVACMEGNSSQHLTVFQSSCPKYQDGYQNMRLVDRYSLERFEGRSINWTSFSFSNSVTVQIHVLDPEKISLNGRVRIFPSRYGATPIINKDGITFTITRPGQYSVE